MIASYNKGYLVTLMRAVDVLACTWIWRDYDVTISSMTGLELRLSSPRRWAIVLGWILNHLQAGHCESAIVADTVRCNQALGILIPA